MEREINNENFVALEYNNSRGLGTNGVILRWKNDKISYYKKKNGSFEIDCKNSIWKFTVIKPKVCYSVIVPRKFKATSRKAKGWECYLSYKIFKECNNFPGVTFVIRFILIYLSDRLTAICFPFPHSHKC